MQQSIQQADDEEPNFLPRVLAFVFPQFHRDALNDRLWGDGFSDWDNLRKAPTHNRLGYAIPRPTELGYYNLTDTEPRKQQGELAREYGIPAVVGVHDATSRLKNGQRIRVDGSSGEVVVV